MSNNNILVILPHQMYVSKTMVKEHRFTYLVEEPIFFYDKVYKPFKPNKVKLAYLRACMKAYHKQFTTKNKPIKYIDYSDYKTFVDTIQSHEFASTKVTIYDPIDEDVVDKYTTLFGAERLNILPSPDLLIDKETLDTKYFKSHNNIQRHASFYEFIKKELDILKGVKNLDKQNRSPPPKDEPHAYTYKPSKRMLSIYEDAVKYVEQHFVDHVGTAKSVILYPITHKDASVQFKAFLKRSLPNFGKYEDVVMKDDPFMYHSVISPMLNNGLLNPREVVNETLDFYKDHTDNIPLSSLEGFIRQVIGWRCMMQSLYIFKHNALLESNTPNNSYTFKEWGPWLTGETGILPLDEEIKKANTYGYSHHIVRLMIFMNFFILCELHPDVIYKWFMEVVSIDAYSWVMISNIYAMGYFYPKVMTKPYLSTSNYIIKMTNYKKDGEWDKIWDALYHDFLRKKPSNYTFFYKRTFKDDPTMKKIAEEFKGKYFIPYKSK